MSQVADSLDVPRALMPFAPTLFDGLTALGSSPMRVARWLRAAGIGPRSWVLDLGCGKGAASIALARAVGCRVVGIDGFMPFVEAARESALRAGVEDRCTFAVGDVRRVSRRSPALRHAPRAGFDAVLMLNVLPAEEAWLIARRWAKPGGLCMIDDAVTLERQRTSAESTDEFTGLPPTAREVRGMVESVGDEVLRAAVMSPREYARLEGELQRGIRSGARRLCAQHPQLAPALRDFARRQREATALLTHGPLRGATWLVRRVNEGAFPKISDRLH